MSGSRLAQPEKKGIGRFIAPFVGSAVLRNQTFLAVSLAVFASYVGIGMVGPVRVLYAESRGASLAIISTMATAYLISNFAFQYPVGWLADRWGRKQVIIIGLLAQAALSAVYLPITDPIMFVVLRFFEGIAAAAVLPSARALIIDSIPAEQQGEAYGIFNAFFNAGFLLGPGLGGILAITNYANAFIGAVAFRLVAVVLAIIMIRIPRSSVLTREKQAEKVPYRALFTLPLIGAYIIAFGDYLYLGFDLTLTPLWMHDHLGASVAVIGFAYMAWSVPNIVLSPLGGRIADRRRRSVLILIFGLAQVPIYLAYGLVNMAILVVVLFAVHGAVYAFIQPAMDSHVARSSPSSLRARVQGMYTTAGLIGSFVGASGFTPLYNINFRLPLFTMGVAYGVFVLIGAVLIRISENRALRLTEQEG